MAEFIDIVMFHEADCPPSLHVVNEQDEPVRVGQHIGWTAAEWGYQYRLRIQHDEIERL